MSWKATARQGQLMVKEFELDPVADVWIVLDLDRKLHVMEPTADRAAPPDERRHYLNSSVEYAVTIAASIANDMLERGRSVGLITWFGQRQVLPPERGARQLWHLLEVLAIAEAADSPPLQEVLVAHREFFAGNHSLLVITPDTSGRWRAGLSAVFGRSLPVTAVYIDALSFDSRLPRMLPLGDQRSDSRFHSYTVRNGDDIAQVLGGRREATSAAELRSVEVGA